jgi:serine/threonine-protein kinase
VRELPLDPSSWEVLDRLLDEALDLPGSERLLWIDGLPGQYEALKPRLRALLARVGSESFLGTIPKFESVVEPEEGDGYRRSETAGSEIGLYRLLREIGEGGMGTVWLAERSDGMIHRPVALKLPRGSWRRALLGERMAREREILATLDHPNIARLYDAGMTPEGEPFLALEYVEGRAIDEYCEAKALAPRERLTLFLQVAKAVAHAHGRLVVHRDLKPSNILVTAEGQVRLLDFGIAKMLEEGEARETEITERAGRVLTPDYASPEQILGEPIGIASDVYSLGVVLFELLTRSRPYKLERGTRRELEDAILEAEPAKPSEVAEDPAIRKLLRGDVDTIVLRALAKEKEKRYPTVNALAEDIERYLDGRPVLARRDSAWYRASKFALRNRLGVGAAAAVLLAIVVGAGVAVWQARVALSAQRRAEQVKEFIAAIFQDANLEEGEGRSLTALDVLNRARGRIETDLDTDPTVRVELLNILGSSLMSLGETATAETVTAGALQEARENLSPDDALALRAGILRSWVLMYRGKTSEARSALDEVFAAVERGISLPAEDLVLAWRVRCGLEIDAGNREESVTAGREAVRLAEDRLPDDHPEKLQALLELAYAYSAVKNHPEALETAERAYRLAVDTHPDNPIHPNVIKARARLGNALAEVGELERGIVEIEQAARDATTVFGPSSMTVGVYLQNLVRLYLRAGRVADALESSKRSLEIHERYFDPDSFSRMTSAEARGTALMAAQRMNESLAPLTEAYDAATRIHGPSDRNTLEARVRWAVALAHTGATDQARREVQAVMEEALLGNIPVYTPLHFGGRIERVEGNFAKALDLQERALELASDGPGSTRRTLILLQIGMLRVELEDYDSAARALEEARRVLGEDGFEPNDAEILIGLGRARMGQDRPAEALPLLEEAERFWRDFDPENRWAGEVSLWLSDCYAALGRSRASEEARKRANDILSRSLDSASARLLRLARRPASSQLYSDPDSAVEKKRASP